MAKEHLPDNSVSSLVTAAFDFGTTFSGVAFAMKGAPSEITIIPWNSGVADKLPKTPTCVLLNPAREFVTFGYDAEDKYSELAQDDEHEGWLLFRQFKMFLHNNRVWFIFYILY